MKQYLVTGLLVLVAVTLIATPVYGQVSTQSLKLNVFTWANHPVKDFTVTATYKGETLRKTLDFSTEPKQTGKTTGQEYVLVQFPFSPKPRGLLDFYNVCVTNLSTTERHCDGGYWLPGTDSSTKIIQIYG